MKDEEVDIFTKNFLLSIQNQELIMWLIDELEKPDVIDFDENLLKDI